MYIYIYIYIYIGARFPRHWILGGSKVNSDFFPFEVDQTRLKSLNNFLLLFTKVFLRFCKCHKCLMSQQHRWAL